MSDLSQQPRMDWDLPARREYRGYTYVRRTPVCRTYWYIFDPAGEYASYASTPAEACALIDTYISWGT